MSEVRLVATIRLPSGNLAIPNHGTGDPARDNQRAWENGITMKEADMARVSTDLHLKRAGVGRGGYLGRVHRKLRAFTDQTRVEEES